MRHILVCPEYPPGPHAGGIGTYTFNIGNLLADAGEIVHVVCRNHQETTVHQESSRDGRLFVHRIPATSSDISRTLKRSAYEPQSFAWEAALYIEKLLVDEQIDLIESQEYEAPLFYFQLRRAIGLGPKQRPPCVIHLHSPTELIALYNDWNRHHFDWRFASRLERFSIAAADGVLSPSRHLATYAEEQLNVSPGSVRVIPYPVGEGKLLEREEKIWQNGSVLFVGRFEKRKGILEWIHVALNAARKNSQLNFEFVGGGKIENTVRNLVPLLLRPQFLFHGEQNHSNLEEILKRARIAVVPSRWENFPNTCIEAMASGLPVLATSNGGMVEIVENGKTGWLAHGEGESGLTEAFEKALLTNAETLAMMGNCARMRVNEICGNKQVLQDHLSFKSDVAKKSIKVTREFFFELFPEFNSCDRDPVILQEQFIRKQPRSSAKRAAEFIRTMKRKLELPIPSALSVSVYRFLVRK